MGVAVNLYLGLSALSKKIFWFVELFFCKKIPLSRRVGYVMGGSVSGSVRDVCHTNPVVKVNGM